MDPILLGFFSVFLVPWVYAIPIISWIRWVVTIALVAFLTEVLKRLIGNDQSWNQRPTGACRCNLSETASDVSHRPGFPSGHATVSTFLVVSLWYLARAPSVLLFGIPWVLWVATNRLQKQCHTVSQVVAGGLLGAIAGLLFKMTSRDLRMHRDLISHE